MAVVRPSTLRTAARRVVSSKTTTTTTTSRSSQHRHQNVVAEARPFSTTRPARSGDKIEYDPPTGWLFGVRPGEKYEREGWEIPFYTLFCGSLVVGGVLMAFKPDTS